MKINNFILITGIFAVFISFLYLALVATAEEVDLGDGQYQEVPPYNDINGAEVEYSGSEINDHPDTTDSEEEYQENDVDQTGNTENSAENNNNEEVVITEENESSSTEVDNQEDTSQDDYHAEIITLLKDIDQIIKKLMISIWVLFGLLLGTKLIKGLFGYGG